MEQITITLSGPTPQSIKAQWASIWGETTTETDTETDTENKKAAPIEKTTPKRGRPAKVKEVEEVECGP